MINKETGFIKLNMTDQSDSGTIENSTPVPSGFSFSGGPTAHAASSSVQHDAPIPAVYTTGTGNRGFGKGFHFGAGSSEAIPVYGYRVAVDYTLYDNRMSTFTYWPIEEKITKAQLCRAGFKYLGIRDHVECVWCGIQIRKFEMLDDAVTEHMRHVKSKNMVCPYLRMIMPSSS